MNIAVIGTGNMATAIAERLVASGRSVLIGGRDIDKARALANAIGDRARAVTIGAALAEASIAFLAVPYDAVGGCVKELAGAAKILVDITNPITPDYMGLTLGHTTSAAEEIQKLVPNARVVKAFNTLFAAVVKNPESLGRTPQVFIAADDQEAEGTVAQLIRDMGFAPIYAGPLANARFLEPVAELNIHLGYALGHGTTIAPAWTGL